MSNATNPVDIGQKDGLEIRIAQAAVKIWRGAAVGIIAGTGYATKLVIATAGMQFIGVSQETSDNTAGTPGTFKYDPINLYTPFIRVARKGLFPFAQSGTTITQAHVGVKVYFADDQTVSLTGSKVLAGIVATVDETGAVWIDIGNAIYPAGQGSWNLLSGSTDAISPNISADYMITTAGVDAMTLAAPTAIVDDEKTIVLSSSTANAHTLTATGLLKTGTASVNVATFAAQAGAGLTLKAYNAKWYVTAAVGITFS